MGEAGLYKYKHNKYFVCHQIFVGVKPLVKHSTTVGRLMDSHLLGDCTGGL